MSAVNEICHIQDEDLLKKMWQETEDFGRKKEIRAHMYKLREGRLKDLYSSTNVDDLHVITNKKTSFNQSMHTDALGDHSFASLKRKEIRDSESPTKDVSYRTKGSSSNEGWNISKIEEHSEDGKSHRFSQSANTSGTNYIPQGKIDFEAKNSQEVTSFQDGDDKNFVKSHGTNSNSYITQEAVGGDGNGSFKTSTTKSSSSSRTVTEQKSSSGDTIDYPKHQFVIEGGHTRDHHNVTSSDSSKITSRKNTSPGEAVGQQQKQITLEIVAGYDQNNARSSSSNTTSSRTVTDQKSYDNFAKQLNVSDDMVVDKTTKIYTTDAPKDLKSHPGYVEGRTKITRETRTLADGTVVTTTKYETKGADEVKSTSSSKQYVNSSNSYQDSKSNTISSKTHDEKFSSQRVIDDHNKIPKNKPASRYYVEKTHTIPSTTEDVQYNIQSRRDSSTSEKRTDTTRNEQSRVDQRYATKTQQDVTQNRMEKKNSENVTKKTVHIELENDTKIQNDLNIRKDIVDKNRVIQKTIATHDVNSVPLGTPIEIEINLTRLNDNREKEYSTKSTRPSSETPKFEPPTYDTPKKREPIRQDSEMTTKTKATDGQYDTTYRTDYTNKKISVEVSPTHDAFARSLRAVSPDRLNSRTSSRHLKNSNSSLRSSSSPEKSYYDRKNPSRISPDRYTNGRSGSPTKKTNEKFSSTETITYKRTPSQRTSPDKLQKRKHSSEIKSTTNFLVTDVKNTSRVDQSPPKNKSRPSIPNNSEKYTNVYEITTDLDDISSTHSHSTITLNKTDKVLSETDSKTVREFYIHNQKTTDKPDHLTRPAAKKDMPVDRPLKRSDTYEERCRQILGITSNSNEKRRSSLDKLRRTGSSLSTQTDSIPKTPREKTGEVQTPKKVSETPRQKSPSKQPQEFPAQIRRPPGDKTEIEPPSNVTRKPSHERSPVKEYPSQKRKTPEKLNKQPSPSRSSPGKSPENRPNREPSSEGKKIQEFPSQVRKTPEKNSTNDRSTTTRKDQKISDTETLGRRSTTEHSLEEYPSQKKPTPYKSNEKSPRSCSPQKTIPAKGETDITVKTYIQEKNLINQSDTREYKVKQNTKKTEDIDETYKTDISERNEITKNQRKSPQKTLGETTDLNKKQTTTRKGSVENIHSNINSNYEEKITAQRGETRKTVEKKSDSYEQQLDDGSSVEDTEIIEEQIIDVVIAESEKDKDEKIDKHGSEIHGILLNRVDDKIRNYVSEDEQSVETVMKIKDSVEDNSTTKEYSTLRRKSTKESIPNKFQDAKVSPKICTKEFINVEQTEMKKEKGEVYESNIENETKKVSELVKSFTSKDTENREETESRKSCPLPKKPDDYGKIEKLEKSTKETEKTEQANTTQKYYIQEQKKPSYQSPNKNIYREHKPTDDELVSTKQSPKTPQNTVDDIHATSKKETITGTIDEVDVETLYTQKTVRTNISSLDDDRRTVKNQKLLRDSPKQKTSGNQENTIVINIEETIIIESDGEIDENTNIEKIKHQPGPTKKVIYIEDDQVKENFDESEHEREEIEFTTIKRKPKDFPSQTISKTPTKPSEISTKTKKYERNIESVENEDEKIKRNNLHVRKTNERKSTKTENISKQRDVNKLTQRTPSSSSLPKKPTTQKIVRGHAIETEENITNAKKSQVQKQKLDSIKSKQSPIDKGVPNRTTLKKPSATDLNRQKPIMKSSPSCEDYSGDSEVEEEIHKKKQLMENYEGKTPVDEPFMTKKTVSLLYSDDEDEKKATQLLIESEIVETQPIINQKKMNPIKTSKTTTTQLIDNEKSRDTTRKPRVVSTSEQITNKTPKRPAINKQIEISTRKDFNRTNSKQNTLEDIETYDNITRNNVHLRSNRVDETVNKKKTSSLGPQKEKPLNKSLETSTKKTTDRAISNKPSSKKIETVEKVVTKISTRNKEITKPEQKVSKPTNPQRSTKTEAKISKSSQIRNENPVSKFKPKSKNVVEPQDSDEESLSDSLNESVTSSIIDLTSITQETIDGERVKKEKQIITHNSQTIYSKEQPKISKQTKTKKLATTKTVINDRGTVDLQRSISSREATPDRVCPRPVTSDDEGVAPRYPDKVVEPDEVSSKRRYDRLLDTSIHEHSDTIQSKKIEEIGDETERRNSRINRVDNDDESLLTVNRKINKFLSTAEKLTEKPIVDISQPAPKVERPKFEVNDDLREDDCLLSVSDKVQKFITEAEHLTKNKETEHRKSVNIDVKTDITNKINQFTLHQQTEDDSRISTKSKDHPSVKNPRDNKYPEKEPNRFGTKLDQDVFITTECAQIEKESDLFRTSKQSKGLVNKPQESMKPTPTPVKASEKNETIIEKEVDSDEDIQFSDGTPSKPRKSSLKEFTPKTRRSSQEEKVILSSVGRLRSNESIKKAKAIFDNAESSTRDEKFQKDILNRPSVFEAKNKSVKDVSTKRTIDRNNVTPKRLDFSSERNIENKKVKPETNERQNHERDVPGYMKPLNRNSQPRDHTPEPEILDHPDQKHTDHVHTESNEAHLPGYMKPLDRSVTHQNPQSGSASPAHKKYSTHDEEPQKHQAYRIPRDEVPGYMKPIDHSHKHQHDNISSTLVSEEQRYVSKHLDDTQNSNVQKHDVPGYMKPIDRSHKHQHEKISSTFTSEEQRYISNHSDDVHHRHYTHEGDTHSSSVLRDDVPGYMKPIDRSHKHQHETSSALVSEEQRNASKHSDDVHHRHYTHESDTHSSSVPRDDVPGYMKPIDRSHKHQHEISSALVSEEQRNASKHSDDVHHRHYTHESDTHSSSVPRDDVPGYMKPIDRSHKHQHETSSTLVFEEQRNASKHSDDDHHRQQIHEGDTPGYMKPLDRSQHHHSTQEFQDQQHISKHSVFGSDAHKHHTSIDWTFKPRSNEDDTPSYMKPLDRSSGPQFDSRERSITPDRHSRTNTYESDGDIPGYMKPLDRSSRPQFDSRDKSISPDRRSSINPDDHNKEGTPGYMKPLDRSARPQFDSRERSITPDRHSRTNNYESDGDIPGYMKPLDRSSRPQFDTRERSKSPEAHKTKSDHNKTASPERNFPGYMKPLDRNPQHDHRERSKSPESKYKKSTKEDTTRKDSYMIDKSKQTSETTTKFGVTLKRTDSGRVVTSSLKTDKKHPLLMKKNITEEEIDEIYDLELLEELLLKFTIYEIRRKIRTQIKIVKKLISEGKLEIIIHNSKNNISNESQRPEQINKRYQEQEDLKLKKTNSRSKLQENVHTNNKNNRQESISTKRNDILIKNKQEVSEYKVSSSRKESFSSTYTTERSESRRSVSPGKQIIARNRKTPERSSPERKQSSKKTERNVITEETKSFQTRFTTNGSTNNISKSNLKKTEPKSKTPTSSPQPEWVTQRNLKKIGTNEVVKKSSVTTSKINSNKQASTKSRNFEQIESTDLIASSYGIGPTDENGAPLFGLRALRAQNTNGTSKVKGTVISSEYYSETGKEPIGQISVTKYSSDPRDLGSDENLSQNGDILSVTTTQRYGYEDTPSLKQLTKTDKKETCDSQTNRRRSSTKTSTLIRKNSVKALTQKFVENADEKKKNERQTSYPKAGLILRSSSFKNESEIDDSHSGISAEEKIEKRVSVKSSKSTSGSTFLSNKTKVTGVQDAISRMKTKDAQYGDTEEDVEAKDLLNKYLGTQVILSGLEGNIKTTGTASSTSSFTASAKSTSRITTVTMEDGKEVTRTKTFEHPVSDEVLETVWDEQTLRYLLDQSTDYEERKRIRARLRLIMAEQEACTELVKQASQDQSSQSIDEKIETSKEVVTEGPVTTTKVTRVSTQQHVSKKPLSPFAKFRQLDKQNSLNTPPSTPRTPGGSPLFKFTDAALSQSASTIKDRLLYWCRMKTKEYENIQLDNFSSSWADGLAFCALIHHFLPDAFDYHALTPKERRHNFTLAFKVADEKADIAPLLDVDDMVATMRPDWKCVFTYVQSIYRRFKDED